MHYVLALSVITAYIYFRFGKKPLGIFLAICAALAMIRGLIAVAIPAAIIAYLLLKGEATLRPRMRGRGRGQDRFNAPIGQPTIAAPGLAIFLNGETGAITGQVRNGPLAGKQLARLSEADLINLLARYRSTDKESEQLLIAYLDMAHPEWRKKSGNSAITSTTSSASSGKLHPRDALTILGLTNSADDATIKQAHRRLMKKFHPDQGGSPFLAAKINMAKDLLLAHRN